jgi:hypothetical protein
MKFAGRIPLFSIILLTAFGGAAIGRADSTFNFSFDLVDGSSNHYDLEQTVTATALGGGFYGITRVNGTVSGPGASYTLDGSTETYAWSGPAGFGSVYDYNAAATFAYDNILNVSGMGTLFSIDGELFSFDSGTYFVNLFFNPPDDVSVDNPDAGYSWLAVQEMANDMPALVDDGTFTIRSEALSSTPEPSAWLLLASGLLALAALKRRSCAQGRSVKP